MFLRAVLTFVYCKILVHSVTNFICQNASCQKEVAMCNLQQVLMAW